jgi:hypothetical protein
VPGFWDDVMGEENAQAISSWLGTPETGDDATAVGESSARAEQPDGLWGQVGQFVGDVGRGLSQEGIGGLLDPGGMMDRQQAQRDLSSRFEVVGDDFVGPRNHNQVSQEEYEDIARTFSDIRTGRGDLTIDTSEMTDADQEERYRDGTLSSIADMMMTTSGRQQVNNMSNNVARNDDGTARTDADGNDIHRHTTIRALYNDTDGDGNWLNDDTSEANYRSNNAVATAYGAHGEAGSTLDATGYGTWYRDAATGERGAGFDSTIWWNPDVQAGDCDRGDVVLAHEMQHALHETQGTMAAGTFSGAGPDSGSIRNYERQAVGLGHTGTHYPGDPDGCTENTYRAERNQLGVGDNFLQRQNYSGRMPGQAPP